jgi:hypothetical protein
MWWWHWLLGVLGVTNVSGKWYGFWSGFGSDISEFAIIAGLAGLLRRHNCHIRGCPRIGRHPVEGTPYVVCARHSPHGAPTHEDVLDAHHAAKRR